VLRPDPGHGRPADSQVIRQRAGRPTRSTGGWSKRRSHDLNRGEPTRPPTSGAVTKALEAAGGVPTTPCHDTLPRYADSCRDLGVGDAVGSQKNDLRPTTVVRVSPCLHFLEAHAVSGTDP